MADCLSVLRDFIKTGRESQVVVGNDGIFHFGPISFPKDTLTTFKSSQGRGPHYTLMAVWGGYQHRDFVRYSEYMNTCKKLNIPRVTFVDYKDLIAYLTGKIDTCASIQPISQVLPDQSDESINESERASKKPKLSQDNSMELDESLQEEKKKLAGRLDTPRIKASTPSKSAENVNIDLGAGLSAEKISEIKRKRSANLRYTIKDIDNELEIAEKNKFIEAEANITRTIVQRERNLRNRNSVLQSNKKQFRSIIETVQSTNGESKDKVKGSVDGSKKKSNSSTQSSNQQSQYSYDRYQEIQEEKFWKEKGYAPSEFQIDTRGTFDISTALSMSQTNNQPEPATKQQSTPASNSKSKSPNIPKAPTPSGVPIIVVPSTVTAMITLFNVKDLLQNGVYIPSLEKRNQGVKKENFITIERKKGNNILQYKVIDNTAKLSKKEWDQMVAVFALGAEWQFKNWAWPSTVDIFSHVAGFYLRYDEEAVPQSIKNWDVKILAVSKNSSKKHFAQTASLEFWNSIDQFMMKHKSSVGQQFPAPYYQQ